MSGTAAVAPIIRALATGLTRLVEEQAGSSESCHGFEVTSNHRGSMEEMIYANPTDGWSACLIVDIFELRTTNLISSYVGFSPRGRI